VVASAALTLLIAVAASAWILATEHEAPHPAAAYEPRPAVRWPLSDARGRALRDDALRRAQVRLAPAQRPRIDAEIQEDEIACRFLASAPSGTSAKFDCVLPGGEVVKVKYGRNPELAAEVAATRLVTALGYAADRMSIARRLRCDGCPRYPFMAMSLLHALGLAQRYPARGNPNGYSDFEWVAIERRFPAAAIETAAARGWAWWELDRVDPSSGATRVELDAFRLLAAFLAHWDNKQENQRLVCLDPAGATDAPCARPVAMMQDLGATFGPAKANLAGWRDLPVWSDRRTCTVSMERMPWQGGTFPPTQISEAGRLLLGAQLAAIPDAEVRELFRAARFPEHYRSTDDERDLAAWTAAFRDRVQQIVTAGPCREEGVVRGSGVRGSGVRGSAFAGSTAVQ
jgi:hypothetical protein